MDTIFVIYTPYQLLSALNVIEQYNVLDYRVLFVHPNMDQFLDICNSSYPNRFISISEIYDVHIHKSNTRERVRIAIDMLRKRKIIKKYGKYLKKAKWLYIPSDDMICRIIYSYIKKHNTDVVLNLIDDGVGTYVGKIDMKKNILSSLIYSMFFESSFYENLKEVYCYHPELIKTNNKDIKFKCINMNKNTIGLFEEKIKYSTNNYINKKIIFLDQGISSTFILNCLDVLKKHFDKDEILIKKHPRLINKNLYSDLDVSTDGMPVELIFSLIDVENCLIISDSSTGNLTPYLINNCKPKCILLFRLNPAKCAVHKELISFVEEINKNIGYEYIKTPTSLEVFENYIIQIKDNLKPITKNIKNVI